jgi:hypothetical protein
MLRCGAAASRTIVDNRVDCVFTVTRSARRKRRAEENYGKRSEARVKRVRGSKRCALSYVNLPAGFHACENFLLRVVESRLQVGVEIDFGFIVGRIELRIGLYYVSAKNADQKLALTFRDNDLAIAMSGRRAFAIKNVPLVNITLHRRDYSRYPTVLIGASLALERSAVRVGRRSSHIVQRACK